MVEIFKALSEETRLRIISILLEDDLCVCEIEYVLKLTQSNTSKHLGILKSTKILESYRNAQWTYYKINESFKTNYYMIWKELEQKLKEIPTYEKDKKELKKSKDINLCDIKKIN